MGIGFNKISVGGGASQNIVNLAVKLTLESTGAIDFKDDVITKLADHINTLAIVKQKNQLYTFEVFNSEQRQIYILTNRNDGPLDNVTSNQLFYTVNEFTNELGTVVSRQFNQNNITFKNPTGDYFGTADSFRNGTLTFDFTEAVIGGVAIVFYKSPTLQMPSVWLQIGTFVPNEINKIYLERDSQGYITANIVPVAGIAPSDTTPPSNIGTLTITNEGVAPSDTTPPSTIGTLTITNEGVAPSDTTPPSTIGTLTITNT